MKLNPVSHTHQIEMHQRIYPTGGRELMRGDFQTLEEKNAKNAANERRGAWAVEKANFYKVNRFTHTKSGHLSSPIIIIPSDTQCAAACVARYFTPHQPMSV